MTLSKLYDLTLYMSENVNILTEEDLEELIALRDEVLNTLQASTNIPQTDRRILSEILKHDVEIVGRMNELKEEASIGLEKIQISRIQKNAYDQGHSEGSYFFDKKK